MTEQREFSGFAGGPLVADVYGPVGAPPINALGLVDIAPRLEEAAQHIADYGGRSMEGPIEGLKKNLRLNAQGRWEVMPPAQSPASRT